MGKEGTRGGWEWGGRCEMVLKEKTRLITSIYTT
jgi:hypothetical protein